MVVSGGSRIRQTGVSNPKGAGTNLIFWTISLKSAWKQRQLDPGGASLALPSSGYATDSSVSVLGLIDLQEIVHKFYDP